MDKYSQKPTLDRIIRESTMIEQVFGSTKVAPYRVKRSDWKVWLLNRELGKLVLSGTLSASTKAGEFLALVVEDPTSVDALWFTPECELIINPSGGVGIEVKLAGVRPGLIHGTSCRLYTIPSGLHGIADTPFDWNSTWTPIHDCKWLRAGKVFDTISWEAAYPTHAYTELLVAESNRWFRVGLWDVTQIRMRDRLEAVRVQSVGSLPLEGVTRAAFTRSGQRLPGIELQTNLDNYFVECSLIAIQEVDGSPNSTLQYRGALWAGGPSLDRL